jgi:hypothetical protein
MRSIFLANLFGDEIDDGVEKLLVDFGRTFDPVFLFLIPGLLGLHDVAVGALRAGQLEGG